MRAAASSQTQIRMQGVDLAIQGRRFFRRLHWEVRAGETWAIVGSNGAGKTLLASLLAGETAPDRGTVEVLNSGDAAADPRSVVEVVSFEDQETLLVSTQAYHQVRWHGSDDAERQTVSDFLSRQEVLGLNPYEVLPPAARFAGFQQTRRRVMRDLGLEPLRRRAISRLSNGEMRRALIARALLRAPLWLVLDDPFTGMDPDRRGELSAHLDGLVGRGQRVLFVARRREDLPACVSHLLCLHAGRVVEQGPRSTLERAGTIARTILGTAVPRATRIVDRAQAQRRRPGRVVVQFSKVNIRYGRSWILRDVDWTIRAGEHWAVLGPNGAGKTTLLSLLLGDNPQVYGNEIRLFGRQLGRNLSLWELRRRIAVVSLEIQAHYPGNETGRDVVCSGWFDTLGLFGSISRAQRRQVDEQLESLGLRALSDRSYGELSAGEQRMLLLARALIKRPRLLVLDEPCTGLDAANRKRFLRVLERAAATGRTQLVVVTHHPEDIPACVEHVLRLRAGRAAADRR